MSSVFPLVDAHVHFWNPQLFNYPWLSDVPPLHRSFLPEDYQAAAESLSVGKMVFVECGCDPEQALREVAWITGLAAQEPRLRGIVTQSALERGDGVRDDLAVLAENPLVKGIRRNLQSESDAEFCLRPDFLTGVRALSEFGFTFDLCVTHGQLPSVVSLVRHCPEIIFILDHGGKPAIRDGQLDPWRKNVRELAALPNVVCKISGLVTEASPDKARAEDLRPYVNHLVDSFGFDRVLFGGDWPVCQLVSSLSLWLGLLEEILVGESADNRTKLFQTNAERIYHV